MKSLTITLLTHNAEKHIIQTINGILSQTAWKKVRPEVIAIDNGSTDNTLDILRTNLKNAKIVGCQKNLGYLWGINRCLSTDTKNWILYVSSDVILDSRCVENLVDFLGDDEHVVYQPLLLRRDGSVDNAGMKYVWPGYGVGIMRPRGALPYTVPMHSMVCFLSHPTIYKYYGLYDESLYPAYYEDWDMYLRRRGKVRSRVIPMATAWHLNNQTLGSQYGKKIRRICHVNRKKVIQKNFKGPSKLLRTAAVNCIDFLSRASRA